MTGRRRVLGGRAVTLARVTARSHLPPPKARGNDPLVSVVIATYNWPSVLRYAIESVRAQSYPAWELLVVGDACTDETEETVRSFGDRRIRWHNLEQNAGSQYGPNNAGIELARGEYVAYLGHDDLWTPDHLTRAVNEIRRRKADAAYAATAQIGPPGSGLRNLAIPPGGHYRGGHLPPSAVVHRTDMAGEIGGWRDYREIADPPDTDFFTRALRAGNTFVPTWALTVFKFPSAMRPGSYREQRSGEQEEWTRRMQRQRLFRVRELAAIVRSRLRHPLSDFERLTPAAGPGAEPGEWVRSARRIRGLD